MCAFRVGCWTRVARRSLPASRWQHQSHYLTGDWMQRTMRLQRQIHCCQTHVNRPLTEVITDSSIHNGNIVAVYSTFIGMWASPCAKDMSISLFIPHLPGSYHTSIPFLSTKDLYYLTLLLLPLSIYYIHILLFTLIATFNCNIFWMVIIYDLLCTKYSKHFN